MDYELQVVGASKEFSKEMLLTIARGKSDNHAGNTPDSETLNAGATEFLRLESANIDSILDTLSTK
ncbi:MAG: hypothetical protein KDK39_14755 [Leptospiraceae bacterium]|nr:hypothetical protein [Leptospiraceae bacterium]